MDNENIKNTAEETAEETDIKGGECDGMKNQKKEKKSDKKETEALKAEESCRIRQFQKALSA